MRGSRKFRQRGSNSDVLFLFCLLVGERRMDPKYHLKRAIIGPPAKRNYMAFLWRANDGPTLNTGLAAL